MMWWLVYMAMCGVIGAVIAMLADRTSGCGTKQPQPPHPAVWLKIPVPDERGWVLIRRSAIAKISGVNKGEGTFLVLMTGEAELLPHPPEKFFECARFEQDEVVEIQL